MECNNIIENFPDIAELENSNECCPVDWAFRCVDSALKSACGQTTICRDGLLQLWTIISDIKKGKGQSDDCSLLEDLCGVIKFETECSLSVKAAEAVLYSIEKNRDEWEKHCLRKICSKMICEGCYTLYIDPARCNGCGKCLETSPEGSILGGNGMIHVIVNDSELNNDNLIKSCPIGAICKAGAVKPQLPATPVPVGTFAGGGLRRKRVSRLDS